MEDRIRLQLPAFKSSHRKLFAHLKSVHALHSWRLEQLPHGMVHLCRTEIPEFDWQFAPVVAQQVDADPRACEITNSSTANDDAPSREATGGRKWDLVDELVASHRGPLEGQWLPVVVGSCAGQYSAVRCSLLPSV